MASDRKTVMVDAEALHLGRAYLIEACFEDAAHSLTPIVPELPEGCVVVSEARHSIVVLWDVNHYAEITHGGLACWTWHPGEEHCQRFAKLPHAVNKYLSHRWSEVQDG